MLLCPLTICITSVLLLSLFFYKHNFAWYSVVLPTFIDNRAMLPTLIVIVLQFDCFMFLFVCFTQYRLLFSVSYYSMHYLFIACLVTVNNGCHLFSVASCFMYAACFFFFLLIFLLFFTLCIAVLSVFSSQCLNEFNQGAPRLKNLRVLLVSPGLIVNLIVQYLHYFINQAKQ